MCFQIFPIRYQDIRKNLRDCIIWDFRPAFNQLITPSPERYMEKIYDSGIRNIWLQIHNWQANHGAGKSYGYSGYDDGLPSVLPPNSYYGGATVLNAVIKKAHQYNYRVGLHENYVDYYTNSDSNSIGPGYRESDVSR